LMKSSTNIGISLPAQPVGYACDVADNTNKTPVAVGSACAFGSEMKTCATLPRHARNFLGLKSLMGSPMAKSS
jgi:hypothetical protein